MRKEEVVEMEWGDGVVGVGWRPTDRWDSDHLRVSFIKATYRRRHSFTSDHACTSRVTSLLSTYSPSLSLPSWIAPSNYALVNSSVFSSVHRLTDTLPSRTVLSCVSLNLHLTVNLFWMNRTFQRLFKPLTSSRYITQRTHPLFPPFTQPTQVNFTPPAFFLPLLSPHPQVWSSTSLLRSILLPTRHPTTWHCHAESWSAPPPSWSGPQRKGCVCVRESEPMWIKDWLSCNQTIAPQPLSLRTSQTLLSSRP